MKGHFIAYAADYFKPLSRPAPLNSREYNFNNRQLQIKDAAIVGCRN